MNVVVRPQMTPETFLAWEKRQDRKWEFDGVRPVAMTGGTGAHSAIQGNVITALNVRLRGRPCRPHGPGLKVQIGAKFRYPDALVTCTAMAPGAVVAPDPVVLIEILSDSTDAIDRTQKLIEYGTLPSVRQYILLEQTCAEGTLFTRNAEGWAVAPLTLDDTLAMPAIGIEVPVAEFYADITFPEASDVGGEER